MGMSLARASWAAVLAAGCGISGCGQAGYPQRTVSLRVTGNVADAQVTIDDMPVGALAYVAAHGVALPPGQHRVTVERTGFFPWDSLFEAKKSSSSYKSS